MDILTTPKDMSAWRQSRLGSITLVPTMGALHSGHATLVEKAVKDGDAVVSIFVNPTQFAPNEDLNTYPQTLEADLALLESLDVASVFVPTKCAIYPDGFDTFVKSASKARLLCGSSRPTHFDGVLTIVSKLFNIIKPARAYFGKKDYQQLKLVRQMTSDLSFDVKVVGCDIVREKNGLAMSSRNIRLTDDQKERASAIHRLASDAKEQALNDHTLNSSHLKKIKEELIRAGLTPDYVTLCDRHSLKEIDKSVKGESVLLIAAKIGDVRLIDNIEL